jgi:hypothetical protein
MTPLPETDLARIRQWCNAQVPDRLRDQVMWEAHARGKSVTLCETRAPWNGEGDWTHQGVAQLRYRPESQDWSLHWADRNSRWHVYDPDGKAVTGSCAELLDEVDRDPTCIFKG